MSHGSTRRGHLAFVLRTLVSLGLVFTFVAAAPLVQAQRRRPTERVTLVVEVIDREATPTMTCGFIGPQPRDVSARVITVEEGTYGADQILLSWPLCLLGQVMPGHRYRIHIRRFTDVAATPETRYRVRGFDPITD